MRPRRPLRPRMRRRSAVSRAHGGMTVGGDSVWGTPKQGDAGAGRADNTSRGEAGEFRLANGQAESGMSPMRVKARPLDPVRESLPAHGIQHPVPGIHRAVAPGASIPEVSWVVFAGNGTPPGRTMTPAVEVCRDFPSNELPAQPSPRRPPEGRAARPAAAARRRSSPSGSSPSVPRAFPWPCRCLRSAAGTGETGFARPTVAGPWPAGSTGPPWSSPTPRGPDRAWALAARR
jgi:hypothetical protein